MKNFVSDYLEIHTMRNSFIYCSQMCKIERPDSKKSLCFMYSSRCTSMAEFALSDTYRKYDNILSSRQKDVIFIAD